MGLKLTPEHGHSASPESPIINTTGHHVNEYKNQLDKIMILLVEIVTADVNKETLILCLDFI